MNQHQNNRPSKPSNRENEITFINQKLQKMSGTLSQILTPEDLYLPDGMAYKIAIAIQDLNISQLRKIFDLIDRSASLSREGKFEQSQETLFMVVPMVAYAAGRQLIKPMDFNDFIQLVITPQRIKGHEDIQALYKLMQTIIAYKKR